MNGPDTCAIAAVTDWVPADVPADPPMRLRDHVFRVTGIALVTLVVVPLAVALAFLVAPVVVPLLDPFGR